MKGLSVLALPKDLCMNHQTDEMNKINTYINNNLQVAHPHSGSSSTWFLVELEFGNVGFWGEGKTGVPGEKPLGTRERTNSKLKPHMASMLRLNLGHTGGRRVLSPLHHPCSALTGLFMFEKQQKDGLTLQKQTCQPMIKENWETHDKKKTGHSTKSMWNSIFSWSRFGERGV